MNNQELPPITLITSLVIEDAPTLPHRPKPPRPAWHEPFIDFLDLSKVIDRSRSNPNLDDCRFCFQPSSDLSRLLRIFVSIQLPSSVRYEIDLKDMVPGSEPISHAVFHLQQYAYAALQGIQYLRDCLIKYNIITDPKCFLYVDMRTCPLCHSPLSSCYDCEYKVACSSPSCAASQLADCHFCYAHGRMVCFACLNASGTIPPLIACPVCRGWCCREDVDWCPGVVTHPAQYTREFFQLSSTSDWDSNTVYRDHPPKPSPCGRCTDHDMARNWLSCLNTIPTRQCHRCPSSTPTMIRLGLRATYCPVCVQDHPGRYCLYECTWLCDVCVAIENDTKLYLDLVACPRCTVSYCTDPEDECAGAIGICQACKRPRLCNDCQEAEAASPGEVSYVTEHVRPAITCCGCDGWTCEACRLAGRVFCCFYCEKSFCVECLADEDNVVEKCPFCDGYVCRECRKDHVDCPGDVVLASMRVPPNQNQTSYFQEQTMIGPLP